MKNINSLNNLHKSASIFHFSFLIVFWFWGCARIDNNRREYCASRAAQLCVHACVLRFFSSFVFLFYWFSKTQHLRATLSPLWFVICCVFFLCENRQQPTWILCSPSCTVVHTCVCAPFFFSFSHAPAVKRGAQFARGLVHSPFFLFNCFVVNLDVRE